MKIKRIVITNFRGIAQFTASLNGAMLLVGPNGCGKSSVLEAVRYALYGRCANTDKRGAGASDLIRDGEREASVTLSIDINGRDITVITTIPAKGKPEWICHDSNGEIIEDRAALWSLAGISPETAEATANMYEALATGGFGDMLSVALADTLPWNTVMDHAKEHAEWLTSFAQRCGLKPSTPDEYQALGNAAYTRRTSLNKQLKEAQENLDAVRYIQYPLDDEGNPVTDLDAVQSELKRLRLAHDEAIEQRGRVSGNRLAVTIEKDRKAAEDVLRKAEQNAETAQAEHADAIRAINDIKSEIGRLSNEDSRIRGELVRVEGALSKWSERKCPTCKTDLADDVLEKLIGDERRRKSELDGMLESCRNQAEAMKKRKSDAENALASSDKKLQAALKPLPDLRDRLAVLNSESPSDPGLLEALDARISTIEENESRLKEAARLLGIIRGRDEANRQVSEMQEEVGHLTFCVESFKDGVLLKALMPKGKRDAFLAALNRELTRFGYHGTLQQDGKTLSLMLGRDEGKPRHWKRCSDGERCVAEICCAMVYSRGRSVVLVDNVDRLDAKNKEALRKALAAANHTIVMACAWGQTTPPGEGMIKAFAPASVKWMGDETAKEVAA